MDNLEKIYAIIADGMSVDPATLTEDTNIKEKADSLSIAQIVFATEDEFGISISTEETANIQTIGEYREFIEKLIAAKK